MSVLTELSFPLIQAPMAGGPTTPELVAAVAQAGCLGSVGGALMSPAALADMIKQVQALTARPFAVNLFAPTPALAVSAEAWQTITEHTRTHRQELGLADPMMPAVFAQDFTEQIQVILQLRPRVFSFIFGIPPADIVHACRERGIATLGTATQLAEAVALQEAGVDCICAQGVEAGGHRGAFLPVTGQAMPVLSLVQAIRGRLRGPLIAAGGIMNGRGIAAALLRGADAVQMGTAFLACPEAGTAAPYRAALLATDVPKQTAFISAFSGRPARGLINRFSRDMEPHADAILPFPAQNAFTRDIRDAATQQNRAEFLSLWAGQGINQIRSMPVKQLIDTLRSETAAARRR